MKVHRKIIEIDEERCDGCGLCIIGCAEGALKIVDGKAKVTGVVDKDDEEPGAGYRARFRLAALETLGDPPIRFDGKRWKVTEPLLKGWQVNYAVLDTRMAPTVHVGAGHYAFGPSVQSAPLTVLEMTLQLSPGVASLESLDAVDVRSMLVSALMRPASTASSPICPAARRSSTKPTRSASPPAPVMTSALRAARRDSSFWW